MAAAFLWTLDALARTNLENYFKPIQIVLVEHLIINLILVTQFTYLRKLKQFNAKEWGALLFIGIGGSAIATIAITEAYFTGSIIVAVLLQQTQPIIAIGLAHIILKERLPSEYFIWATFAIMGVFLIYFPFMTNFTNDITKVPQFIASGDVIKHSAAFFWALLAAFFWGGSTVFGRYLLEHSPKKISYREMTVFRFFVAFIFLIVLNITFLLLNPNLMPTIPTKMEIIQLIVGSFLFIALFPGLISLILYYYGLKSTHATISTICELFYPLSAFVLIPLFIQQQIFEIQIAGGILLIIASTILSIRYAQFKTQLIVEGTTSPIISS